MFAKHTKKHLPLSDYVYTDLGALQSSPPKIDACIFGSDQIWNPQNTGMQLDPAYFGEFGPSEMCRIAYAPSLGVSSLPKEFDSDFAKLLQRLDHISARERSGAEMIKRVAGLEAPQVADPTFLIDSDEFPRTAPRVRGEFVAAYFLQPTQEKARIAARIASQAGVKLVKVGWTDGGPRHVQSPTEAAGFLSNAKVVITDSFHGLAMSLVFETPVRILPLVGKMAPKNERLFDLLERFSIGHLLLDQAQNGATDSLNIQIDWDHVSTIRFALQAEGLRFLRRSLECTAFDDSRQILAHPVDCSD